jgi:hypothetical protein
MLREQRPLCAVFAFDKTLHLPPHIDEIANQRLPGRFRLHSATFLCRLGQKRTFDMWESVSFRILLSASLTRPSLLDDALTEAIQRYAVEAYNALGCDRLPVM